MENMVGRVIPKVNLPVRVDGDWTNINTHEMSRGKRIIIFALPGAYTPTCSTFQLPGFEEQYSAFQEKGIDEIYCLSVNDTFVMNSWFTAQGIEKVKALPDGNCKFTRAVGAHVHKENLGFGIRSWRYAMVVNDTITEKVFWEEGYGDNIESDPYEVSTPENVLANI
tara:strand:- start:4567 stop:5067 length:501 start_codon:yes stop_codon:yes gene_type:complete